MTRATVEDGSAGLGQTLRSVRLLVGGLSFHGVSELCMNSSAHGLPGGNQAQGTRRPPMQAWVSCSGSRTTACVPQALGGDLCGEQGGLDFKHSTTTLRQSTSASKRVQLVDAAASASGARRSLQSSTTWKAHLVIVIIMLFSSCHFSGPVCFLRVSIGTHHLRITEWTAATQGKLLPHEMMVNEREGGY